MFLRLEMSLRRSQKRTMRKILLLHLERNWKMRKKCT